MWVIERLIGQKVPVDGEHSTQDRVVDRSSSGLGRKQRPRSQRSELNGQGPRKTGKPRSLSDVPGNSGNPKRRRCPRHKVPRVRQSEQQAT